MKTHKPKPNPFERHKRENLDTRVSAALRGYDGDWERLRDAKLASQPLCECEDCRRDGLLTPATVVDHIVPISEQPELRLMWGNLRSMSKACHDRRTMRDQVHGRVVHGCDADGIPLDPLHPWRIYEDDRQRAESLATEPAGPTRAATRTPPQLDESHE